ncbi:MAG: hypothetical protein AB8B66_00850 [Rickettsiaceae bacterium]
MRVYSLPKEAINELQTLVGNEVVDINSPAVINSMFYHRIQNERVLSFREGLDPALQLFMMQIAVTSPSLLQIDVMGCNLGEHGPATEAVFTDRNNAAQALINELLETNREYDLFPDDLMNLIGEYISPPQHIELVL